MSNSRLMTKQKDCLVAAEFSSTGVTTGEGRGYGGAEHEQETKLRILWIVDSQSDPRRSTLKTVSLTTDPQNSSPSPILPILIGQETTGPCKWQETSSCHSAGNDAPFLTGEPSRTSLGIHKHLDGARDSRTPASPGQSELRKLHLIFFFSLCCLTSPP